MAIGFLHQVGALVPPSTIIKERALVSYGDLDRVKAKIKTYEASSDKKVELLDAIRKDLTNIIDAFNNNIKCCRNAFGSKEMIQFKVVSGTTPTTQSSYAPTSTETHDATKELGLKEIEDMLNAGIQDDALSFQQLGAPLDRLKGKIEKMIERAAKQSLPKDQFPELLQPEIVEKYKMQTLGQYRPVVVSTSTATTPSSTASTEAIPTPVTQIGEPTPIDLTTSATTLIARTTTSPSTSTTTERMQLVEPHYTLDASTLFSAMPTPNSGTRVVRTWTGPFGDEFEFTRTNTSPSSPESSSPPTHWPAKIYHPLEPNTTLGICFDPNWDTQPVPFTTNDGGSTWTGQVPWGIKFKYVIIVAPNYLRWEDGDDRQITDAATADSVANRDPKFLS